MFFFPFSSPASDSPPLEFQKESTFLGRCARHSRAFPQPLPEQTLSSRIENPSFFHELFPSPVAIAFFRLTFPDGVPCRRFPSCRRRRLFLLLRPLFCPAPASCPLASDRSPKFERYDSYFFSQCFDETIFFEKTLFPNSPLSADPSVQKFVGRTSFSPEGGLFVMRTLELFPGKPSPDGYFLSVNLDRPP